MSAPNEWQRASAQRLTGRLLRQTHAAQRLNSLRPEGRLQRVVGLTLEVVGCRLPIGARVKVDTADGHGLDAEVVGFAGERPYLMPTRERRGLVPQAPVHPLPGGGASGAGEDQLG